MELTPPKRLSLPGRNLVLAFLFSVLLTTLAHVCYADAMSEARSEIEAVIASQDTALVNKDVTAALAIYASTLQLINEEGNHWGLPDERKRLTSLFADVQSLQQKTTISQCRGIGTKALLVVHFHRETVRNQPVILQGQTMVEDDTLRETWSKSAEGWHVEHIQWIARTSTLGGKANFLEMRSEIHQEVKSPDGKNVAVLAYRDGLTFGYYYITLQPILGWHHKSNALVTQEGLTKITEVAAEGLEGVKWKDAQTLIISYNGKEHGDDAVEFVVQKKQWNSIRIVYRKKT